MGYSDSPKSIGLPSLGLDEDIIATILDILRISWQAVVATGELGPTSHEPDIAGRLGRAMLSEKKKRKITHLRFEEEVGTRSSPNAPKVEGRIDIKVIYSFVEEEYFGIECKRISSRKSDRLAIKYVDDGVARFVTGKYSPNHNWAAMAGFVIDNNVKGAISIVAERISANQHKIHLKKNWMPEKRFGPIEHLYVTYHKQACREHHINLLHLFLNLILQREVVINYPVYMRLIDRL